MKIEDISDKEAARRDRRDFWRRWFRWAFQVDTLPGKAGELRPPTFIEAWTGIHVPPSVDTNCKHGFVNERQRCVWCDEVVIDVDDVD